MKMSNGRFMLEPADLIALFQEDIVSVEEVRSYLKFHWDKLVSEDVKAEDEPQPAPVVPQRYPYIYPVPPVYPNRTFPWPYTITWNNGAKFTMRGDGSFEPEKDKDDDE